MFLFLGLRFVFIAFESRRADAIETVGKIRPLRVREVGGCAGQPVCPDRLPVHQIGAGLDHHGLMGDAGEGEAEVAGLDSDAAAANLRRRRAQHHCGRTAKSRTAAARAVVVINRRAVDIENSSIIGRRISLENGLVRLVQDSNA